MNAHFHPRLAAIAVLLAASVLFLARLGDRAVTSEEFRWAQIAREMIASGDYLHPTINGRTYYDKPIGSYWLIVAASYVTGGVEETAARLPAALAGILGVWLVMSLGRRLYDDRSAILAGAILATSFGYVFYARRATADLETVTGVLAAVWIYARSNAAPGAAPTIGLWLVMAATSLTKGLLGFALPMAVFAVDGCRQAFAGTSGPLTARLVRENRWLLNAWTLLAAPLGICLYLLPFLLSAWHTGAMAGLEMVWRENIQRFVAPHNHTGPMTLYVGAIFVLTAPWCVFLPAALVARGENNDGLAKVFFWTLFAFFTISASRRNYYLMPVTPAAALLIGRALTATELGPIAARLRTAGWSVLFVGVAAAGLGLVSPDMVLPEPYCHFPPLPVRGILLTGWIASVAAFAWSIRRVRWRPAVAAGVAFAGVIYVFLLVLPYLDDLRTRRQFLAQVQDHIGEAPDRLALFHARDAIFDLAHGATELQRIEDVIASLRTGPNRWVLARRRSLSGVDVPGIVVLEEAVQPWETNDQAADKLVLLEARRVSEGVPR